MGIARGAYRLLLEEKKRGVLKGENILQLGRQCILFDQKTLNKYAKKHGVDLVDTPPKLSFEVSHQKLGYIDDVTLFKSLGFKNVHSLDNSDYEGADLIWDLNQEIPKKYWGKFDVIYDGGTAEHVFHFPQFLRNIHLLLKEGGVIIHISPSHNHVDHGFYMFSPLVYSEYYFANRYDILTSHIFEYNLNHHRPWRMYNYELGMLDNFMGRFGKKLLAIHIIAQKTSHSTNAMIPQQGRYANSRLTQVQKSPQFKRKVDPITRLGISLKKKFKRYFPSVHLRLRRKWKLRKFADF